MQSQYQAFKTGYIHGWVDSPVDDQSDYLAQAEIDSDTDGLDILLELDDDEIEVTDADDSEWDEPEPLVEYDGELRRQLYVIDEYDDDTLGIDLRIDQWVAGLDAINIIQRSLVAELLRKFGRNRLRRWLLWLDKQQWTGESLLLFLRFRVHWESNPHLWEYSFWDWRANCWYPTRSRYSLSLDDTYELVCLRLDCHPSEIIDETWLGDWVNLALWRHGFRSFASFAKFRAGFTSSNGWLRHIDWYALDDLDGDEGISRWQNGDRLYRYGPPTWFAEQNWYEPREWHDNLGW